MSATESLEALKSRARACTLCAEHLPLGPRPVLRGTATSRLLIVGQAPGTRVHETGIPWNDASGKRLRSWLGMADADFYDETRVAIVPMGLCYPGRDPRGGDKPPRPECAPTWHPPLWRALTGVRLTLLVGAHAQAYYLGSDRRGPNRRRTMTETVRAWADLAGTGLLPLPHPSWRNTHWLRKNPWFETALLPDLRARVAAVFEGFS